MGHLAFGPIFLYFKIRIEKRECSKKAMQNNSQKKSTNTSYSFKEK